MKSVFVVLAAGLLAAPAFAQDAPASPFTVSGTVGLTSDYRFRGVSQSDEGMAVQGGFTIAHESGFYIGTWGSNLAGWGQFGGSNMELDLIGGFKTTLGEGLSLDVGLTWYMYPNGSDKTDFAEPYVKLSGAAGPVNFTVGGAYAPKQQALGNWASTGAISAAGLYDRPGAKDDNIYVWGDVNTAIPGTPVTIKAHVGYSDGNPGLGPNGTSVAPTGKYIDYLVGADFVWNKLTFGIAYVDTDITKKQAAYLQPNFANQKTGGSIADGKVVFSVTAAF